jgi:tetratricopeptide (TPR) repeat protein
MHNLAYLYFDRGQLARAEPLFIKALEVSRRVRGEEHPGTLGSMNNLAEVYQAQGQLAKAEPLFREALEKTRIRNGEASPQIASALAALGVNLLQQKMYGDAEPLLRECLAIREKKEPGDWRTFNTKSMLGGALLGQKKYADAEPLLLAGYEGLKQREDEIPAFGQASLTETLERLVQLYEATGPKEKAAEWRKKLEARREADKKAEKSKEK